MELPKHCEVVEFIFVAGFIILWIHWIWTRRNIYKYGLSFPVLYGFPIIGSLYKIRGVNNISRDLSNIFKDSKSYTVCLWFGWFPTILTADPEIITNVLRSPELLNKAESIYHPIRSIFKGGLVASRVDEWSKNRKLINPAFANKVLMSFFPIFNKAKNNIIEKCSELVDNKEHNLLNAIQTMTLTITAETTMGKYMHKGNQISNDIANNMCVIMEYTVISILLSFMNLGFIMELFSKFRNAKKYSYQFVEDLIHKKLSKTTYAEKSITNTKDDMSSNENFLLTNEENEFTNNEDDLADLSIKKEPNIFIDQAIKLYKQQLFTWNDIISESNTIVGAAFETTANAIYSALVMLAMHPEIQQRLFEEVLDVFPEKNFNAGLDQLDQLQYLDCVINETLRFAPPVPVIGRHVTKDTQVGKNVFPKNTQILISILHLHRRTDIWGSNANKFDPEHFSAENFGEAQKCAFIPFSRGKRNCIGLRYAMFSMKIILSGLIRNFIFETDFKFANLRFTNHVALKYLEEPELKICLRS
ncbi:probable cytochrome P450 313a4 [Teleopsis dalmanni]|uniref:probable cytochrome P450 313a4 n=1 Tax=Teleopsis dalmanni TaxID=139649 RepID=UPI000D32C1C3|nr:probable cytochrome P450 313a4 [Teleopsis dalmanni]